jgi:hypothetical protein
LTVQVAELPEVSDEGLQLRVDKAGASNRIKDAVWEAPFNVAVRVTVKLAMSMPAVAVKLAEVTPAGTVTVAGMVNSKLLSESATMLPPDAAA